MKRAPFEPVKSLSFREAEPSGITPLGLFFLTLFFLTAWAASGRSEDETQGVTAGGVVHNIAEDRKIVKVGGIMQPEPIDFYIKRLFDELFQKIEQMDQRLERIETLERQSASHLPAAQSVPEKKQ